MKWILLLLIQCLCALALESQKKIESLSLPDNLDLKGFELTGNAKVDTNRVILTPKPLITSSDDEVTTIEGSIWTAHPQNLDQFTIELTLRSIGNFGKTGAELNVFLVESITNDRSSFTGLKVQVDSNGLQGSTVKSYLADGGAVSYDDYFAQCVFPYQNSQVPMIMKLSYDTKDLTLSIDNQVCFQTDQVKLDLDKVFFGVVGSSPNDLLKYEQFELLKLKSYSDVETPSVPQQRLNSDIFREQQQRLRERSASSSFESVLSEVLTKLDSLNTDGASSQANAASMNLNKQLSDISKSVKILQEKHNDLLQTLSLIVQSQVKVESKMNTIDTTTSNIMSQLTSFDNRLLQMNSFFGVQKEANGVQMSKLNAVLAMLGDFDQSADIKQANYHDKIDSLSFFMKFVLIPIFVVLIVLFMTVFRLRHDIKHSKIL